MDVAYQLDHEWSLLAQTEIARALRRWHEQQPDLRRFGSPRQLLLFLHSAPPEQTDAPLLALLELARDDELARRTLLQVLLPALKNRADRIVHPAHLREEVWELLLFCAWEAICCYPLERRRLQVAANLVLQVVHRTTRGLRPPLLGHDEIDRHAFGWLYRDGEAADEATLRGKPTLNELIARKDQLPPEAVAFAGVAAGVLSPEDAELILLTRVDGIRLRLLARELRVNYDTLRKRRQRAELALRNVLQSETGVPKTTISDPVSDQGIVFLPERHPATPPTAIDVLAERAA